MLRLVFLFVFIAFNSFNIGASSPSGMKVVGYYAGNTVPFDSIQLEKLTHLIYCFGQLKGDSFYLRGHEDSLAILELMCRKTSHPHLKVMLSLGGWGGCASCSEVFSREEGRRAFAESVRLTTAYFKVDGLDLDWEYPVVKGFPGHERSPDDKNNFTLLLGELRKSCGDDFLLTFAAGGYTDYIDSAIEWKEVMPIVDFVNVMSYDLVHGFSTMSGHHTPLYSTPGQLESTDHAVKLLLNKGVPAPKIVIGAAFYGRVFSIEKDNPVGLYQPCTFKHTFQYKSFDDFISEGNGYKRFFDSVAMAPYAVNAEKRLLATFDNEVSVAEKTAYVANHGLGGIMFWQLCDDRHSKGLLDVIHSVSGNH